ATSAIMNKPRGLAVHENGDVYISDSVNHAIRKVEFASGNIDTIAGGNGAGNTGDAGAATSAKLNDPRGLAIDGAANLYIADVANHRIRHVDTESRIIETVVGTGTSGGVSPGDPLSTTISDPTDVAIGLDGFLYICANGNKQILKVSHDLS